MQDLENLGWAIYVVIPVIGVIGMFFACICGGRDCPVQKGFSILLYCCMWYYIIFGTLQYHGLGAQSSLSIFAQNKSKMKRHLFYLTK